MSQSREQLLKMHAALPEAYQPAWGLPETDALARRACQDRFATLLSALEAFPKQGTLRILDVGCAQGYFSVGLESELSRRGHQVEVVGVDSLADNVGFCAALASHHGARARFIHDRFDDGFRQRHALADFDIVLALNVLHHIRELDGADVAEAVLADIRAHSTVLFCELAQREEQLDWVSEWHAADAALLHGYAFRRRLGRFETHLTEIARPLYACSNHLAYVGGRWFAFQRTLDRAHPGVPDRFAGQRRFFIGSDTLVKVARTKGDFGAFNRTELDTEARVLQALGGEPSRYPPLLAQADDGDELWLARGALPGTLLAELIESGAEFDRDAMVRELLGELAHLQERGYHHADLRAWNMLWHDGEVRLIDFGSMIRDASPLHRVALAAVLAEIARGELSHAQPWYGAVHPLGMYPPEWHGLVRYLVGCEQARFSFAEAGERLGRPGGVQAGQPGVLEINDEVLRGCSNAQVEGFANLQRHAANLEASVEQAHLHVESVHRELERVTLEAQVERGASAKALADAGRYAASLEARIEREGREALAYAQSLKEQIARENATATIEREAARGALAEAAAYAHTLEQEREQLKEQVRQLEEALQRMRVRFRLLKPLWPGEKKGEA